MENKIFVPLFKKTITIKWKKGVYYEPKSKKSSYSTTYPVWVWTYEVKWEDDFWEIKEYINKYWVKVVGRSSDKATLIMDHVDKDEKKEIDLEKKLNASKDWYYFAAKEAVELWWKKYFVNMYFNKKEDKPQNFNLVFTELENQWWFSVDVLWDEIVFDENKEEDKWDFPF